MQGPKAKNDIKETKTGIRNIQSGITKVERIGILNMKTEISNMKILTDCK